MLVSLILLLVWQTAPLIPMDLSFTVPEMKLPIPSPIFLHHLIVVLLQKNLLIN